VVVVEKVDTIEISLGGKRGYRDDGGYRYSRGETVVDISNNKFLPIFVSSDNHYQEHTSIKNHLNIFYLHLKYKYAELNNNN